MQLKKEFAVAVPRERAVQELDSDATFEALFPDTKVDNRGGGVRETRTQLSLAGISRELRFIFETDPEGNVQFHKICDGKIWRSLDGEILLESADESTTRVTIAMDGRTRALVPERAISGQMHSQLDDMADALRDRIRPD